MQLPLHQPCIPVLWCMLDSRQGAHQPGLHLQLPLAQQLRLLKQALLQKCRAPAPVLEISMHALLCLPSNHITGHSAIHKMQQLLWLLHPGTNAVPLLSSPNLWLEASQSEVVKCAQCSAAV